MKFPRRQRNTSAKAKPHKRSATSDSKPSSKSTILAIAIPVIVTVIGAWAAQSIAGYYSRQQREIAQAEAAEKFMPYFDNDPTKHSPQQRYLAIQSLIEIGSYDAAADLVVALPHDYAAIQKARKTADTEGESGKEKSAGDTAQHEPNGQKEDGTTSADDKNFAQILSIYYPKLLPRLAYLAGSANSISKVKQSLGTAVDQTAGSKSVDAIKLIMGDPGGLEAVKSIAFTPAILQSSWLDRVYFRYEQLKLSIFGKKEELTLERTRRLGAIVSINSRIEEITDHIDVFARGEGTRKRLLNRYQSLSQPL